MEPASPFVTQDTAEDLTIIALQEKGNGVGVGVRSRCEVECVEAVANELGLRGIVITGCNAKLS